MKKNIILLLVTCLFPVMYLHTAMAAQTIVDLPHPKGITVRLTFPNGDVDGYVDETMTYSIYDYNVKVLQIPYLSSGLYADATADISILGGEGSWLLVRSSSLDFSTRTLITGSSYLDEKGSTFTMNSSSFYRLQYDYGYLYFTIRGGVEPLEISADPQSLRPDGNSTATLTIKARNDQGNPVAGLNIVLQEPGMGALLPLTGTTDDNGEFKAFYTAPYDEATQGADSVEILAQDTTRGKEAVMQITFNRSSISFLAHPNMSLSGDFPEDVAIIPADSRFPAKYQLTLSSRPGVPAINETLTISLSDNTRADLVGDGDGDGVIQTTTDSQGKAEFFYQYTGAVPQTEPLFDEITVACEALHLSEKVEVSVGLRVEIKSVSEVWEADGEMPEKLGLKVELYDTFRPDMNLVAYWTALVTATEKDLGVRITTEWLNPPNPGFFDNLPDYLHDFVSPPDNEFYDGPAHVVTAGDKIIADACDTPNKVSGEHLLPAVIFQGPGMNLLRVTARPVIINDCGSGTYENLPSPQSIQGHMLLAMVFESESVFKSLTCSFQPTDEKQFLAKTLYLDNPFFKTASYVGKGVAAPVGMALEVVEVANLFCDILNGNYVGAAGTILSKYNSNFTDQIEKLINEGAPLTKNQATAFLMSKTAQFTLNGIGAAASAKEHFGKKTTLSVIDPGDWPDDLSAEEVYMAVTYAHAGMVGSPVLKGYEIVAVVNGSDITLKDDQGNEITDNVFSMNEGEITAFIFPEREGHLSVTASGEELELFRYVKRDYVTVQAVLYTVTGQGKITLDLSSGLNPSCGLDRDDDGSIDETIIPETLAVTIDPSGDGEVTLTDVLLALQVSAGIVPSAYLHAGGDINGDEKIGLEEAVYFLGALSGLR